MTQCLDDKAVFEAHAPDGKIYKVLEDGSIEGFPEGTVVYNKRIAILNYEKSKNIQEANHLRNVYSPKEQPLDMGKEE